MFVRPWGVRPVTSSRTTSYMYCARTSAVNLGNGINSTTLSAAITANGSGMVLGNSPAWAYPVP